MVTHRCPICGCPLEPQNDEDYNRVDRCRNFPHCDYEEVHEDE